MALLIRWSTPPKAAAGGWGLSGVQGRIVSVPEEGAHAHVMSVG